MAPRTDKIRLICFDLDGTLIDRTVFIWSTLHRHFDSNPERRAKAAADYRAGRISYADWFQTDLELLKGGAANRQGMLRAFAGLRPAPGARECLRELKDRRYRLGLISGSIDLALEHFFPERPFDHVLINRISFDAAGEIVGGSPTPYDLEGKADGLAALALREGLILEQCAFVGDNTNDLSAMRAAGFSVGVSIKSPEVAQTVDLRLAEPDLRAILPYFSGPAEQ